MLRNQRMLISIGSASLALVLSLTLLSGTVVAQEATPETHTRSVSFFERLADRLGLTVEMLREAVHETRLEMIDEALVQGRITELQAERMRTRVEAIDGSITPLRRGIHTTRPGLFGHGQALAAVADTLGISSADLLTQLSAGLSLMEIIESHGLTVDDAVAALLAHAQARLDAAVVLGRITQQQADHILEALPERMQADIESGRFRVPLSSP